MILLNSSEYLFAIQSWINLAIGQIDSFGRYPKRLVVMLCIKHE